MHRGTGLEAASREREANFSFHLLFSRRWVGVKGLGFRRKHGEQLKRRQKQRTLNFKFYFQTCPVLLAVSVLIWLALGLLQGSQGLPGLRGARGKQGPLVSTFSLTSPNLEWLRPCGWGQHHSLLSLLQQHWEVTEHMEAPRARNAPSWVRSEARLPLLHKLQRGVLFLPGDTPYPHS